MSHCPNCAILEGKLREAEAALAKEQARSAEFARLCESAQDLAEQEGERAGVAEAEVARLRADRDACRAEVTAVGAWIHDFGGLLTPHAAGELGRMMRVAGAAARKPPPSPSAAACEECPTCGNRRMVESPTIQRVFSPCPNCTGSAPGPAKGGRE